MVFHLRGIKVPHRKNTANSPVIRMTPPSAVTLPTVMHIGAPATPVVNKGDHVDVGTLVAAQNGGFSSPVYSSVSGTVSKVDEILLVTGKTVPAITVESDGEMSVDPGIVPPVINSRDDLINAIRQSGIVGLGGAGFPTFIKLATDKPIDELIINGAECEPYITSDSVTMIENSADMAYAIDMLVKYLDIKKVIIGIEKNKPIAIKSMRQLAAGSNCISVKVLPSVYPQGGEKVLVYHTTGKTIASGKLPIDVGCVVCNCTTVAAIGKMLKTGMPLVEKCITVDGSAVKEPKNVIVPIGTPFRDIFDFCGGFKSEPGKILYGGPMMGVCVTDLDAPVLKSTNAILAFNQKDSVAPKTTACIRCGACEQHCPFGINPSAVLKAYKNNDIDRLVQLGTELCMECGCCSFICPTKQPLTQTNRLAKALLRSKKEAK